MVQKVLTDLSVRKLSEPGYVWDTSLPAFGVRVGKRRKAFVVIRNGRRKTLGLYPYLSLKDAREKAKRALLAPLEAQNCPRTNETVGDYLRSLQRRPRTVDEYRRLLHRHLLPKHGTKRLDEITKRDIVSITNALKHTPTECVHAHTAMRAFFNWTAAQSLIQNSPMSGLPMPVTLSTRERVLSIEELCKIWKAADQMETFGLIVRLLILIPIRKGEAAALDKTTITDTTITWPKELIKNKREHTLPLSKTSKTLSTQLLRNYKTTWNSWSRPKTALDKASGVSNWVLHDIRRSVATHMQGIGIRVEVIEKILNHTSGTFRGIVGVYQRHQYLPEMADALQRWETHFLAHVTTYGS
jgi:integrase